MLPSKYGAALDHRDERAGLARIDPVSRAARDDVATIRDADRLTDDAKLSRLLEGQGIARRGELRSRGRELRIGERASVRVQHPSLAGRELARVRVPLLRGCGDQEPARPGAGLPQFLESVGNAGAAARALVPVLRGEPRRCRTRHQPIGQLFHLDLRPRHIEFFRDQHRERGLHALSDFAAARTDDDASVRLHAHEGVELRRAAGALRTRRPVRAHQQAAERGRGDLQERASRQHRTHDRASSFMSVAARAIALRMRG